MFFHKVSTQLIKKKFFPFHFVVCLSKEVSVSISRASKKVFIQICRYYRGKKPFRNSTYKKIRLTCMCIVYITYTLLACIYS